MKFHKFLGIGVILLLLSVMVCTAQTPWSVEEGAGGESFSCSPTNLDSIRGNFGYTKWESRIAAYDEGVLQLTYLFDLANNADSLLIIVQGRPANWQGASTFFWACDSTLITGASLDNVITTLALSLSAFAGEYRLAFKYIDQVADAGSDDVDGTISICPKSTDRFNERKSYLNNYQNR